MEKATFTITRTETVEIEISVEEGHDMPETIEDIISLDSEIKNNPLIYVHDLQKWDFQSVDVSEIVYE